MTKPSIEYDNVTLHCRDCHKSVSFVDHPDRSIDERVNELKWVSISDDVDDEPVYTYLCDHCAEVVLTQKESSQ